MLLARFNILHEPLKLLVVENEAGRGTDQTVNIPSARYNVVGIFISDIRSSGSAIAARLSFHLLADESYRRKYSETLWPAQSNVGKWPYSGSHQEVHRGQRMEKPWPDRPLHDVRLSSGRPAARRQERRRISDDVTNETRRHSQEILRMSPL